jgi:hypothetical protein
MWRLAVALLLGSPPDEVVPPSPTIEAPIEAPTEGPIEGPAPPPAIEWPDSTSEAGIELATEPPEGEPESDANASAVIEEDQWPTPGTAPSDGWGLVTAGAILMPTAALATWALLQEVDGKRDKVAILAAGGVLELMAIGGMAMGLRRQVKLKRWTLAYRVVAPPQGRGLLTAGGIAINFGVVLIAGGAIVVKNGYTPTGATMIGFGVGGLAVIAPLTLYFGRLRAKQYHATGGWYRPPLPTVELAPRVIVSNDTFGLGIGGRF